MSGDAEPRGVERLDAVAHRLRIECPWDREQDERSIVPHTLEEAYELADAIARRDDGRIADELGDVLFQVVFLSLLLEERGVGDLGSVADGCTEKLIRRHPHVFGDEVAEGAEAVLANWDRIKQDEAGREPGIFGEVPGDLPAVLEARKLQRRAASHGFDWPDHLGALEKLSEEVGELEQEAPAGAPTGPTAPEPGRSAMEHEVGDVLFAAVNVARKLKVDPELALRAATARFRGRVERAVALAEEDGRDWPELPLAEQDAYYERAKAQTPGH